jgi:N-acetyl-anhydromuramyl-L-alanine amidase AmpD
VPNLIVIHTIEGPKNASAAESTGRMFATSTREASAHYTVDSDSIVQSVDERNTGWHAPGANDRGIGIEHAGYAKQTASEWNDAYNRAMLALSARLAADIADRWNIPTRRLSQAELRAGYPGFVSHDDVSRAYGKSDHWDPGPNFPWAAYLAQVDAARFSTGRYA